MEGSRGGGGGGSSGDGDWNQVSGVLTLRDLPNAFNPAFVPANLPNGHELIMPFTVLVKQSCAVCATSW